MKSDEFYFFEKVKEAIPVFHLQGIEFSLGKYNCVITEVTYDPNIELATFLIQPQPSSDYFEGVKIEVDLIYEQRGE